METAPPFIQTKDNDPGDDVQRRFRYQHAFGVVLLIAALRGDNDYVAIWCEHHEDFLAEINDGNYDAFQVKTRDTGSPWQINDESFAGSIKRFAALHAKANDDIRSFSFATNAKPFESEAEDKIHLCPLVLLEGVQKAKQLGSLNGSAGKGLQVLAKKADLSEGEIFNVLLKTKFVTSLPLDGFESLVAHEHLANYDPCKQFAAVVLSSIVERLIMLVFHASSLAISDPARHYAPLLRGTPLPESLLVKRVTPQAIELTIREIASPAFRYLAGLTSLRPASPESWAILQRKMNRGGIGSFFNMLHRRALSAEAALLGIDPSTDLVNQIESLVADQCDEARLKFHGTDDPCGDKILLDVLARFEELSRNQPERVFQQSQEMLVGVAGLLAGDCKVWWSKPFDLAEAAT